MLKKNSNWYIPKNVVFMWSIFLLFPIIAIITAMLIPVVTKLKTLEPVIFYCCIGGVAGILVVIFFFVTRAKLKQ